MAKLFDPQRNVDNSYMMRLSQAIADHRGIFIGWCLLMVVWFALGAFALRNEGVASGHTLSSSTRSYFTTDDYIFWGAVAGGFITLVGGWLWFHRQVTAEQQEEGGNAEDIQAEIAKFKEEKTSSAREERLKRLRDRTGGSGDAPGGAETGTKEES